MTTLREAARAALDTWDEWHLPFIAGSLTRAMNDLRVALAAEQAQEPAAWMVFDDEDGYYFRTYDGNESYRDDFMARNPSTTYKRWVVPLYTHPGAHTPKENKYE
jgi:hypothetical protein